MILIPNPISNGKTLLDLFFSLKLDVWAYCWNSLHSFIHSFIHSFHSLSYFSTVRSNRARDRCRNSYFWSFHSLSYSSTVRWIELGIGLIELGIDLRISNARRTVLARVSGLVLFLFFFILPFDLTLFLRLFGACYFKLLGLSSPWLTSSFNSSSSISTWHLKGVDAPFEEASTEALRRRVDWRRCFWHRRRNRIGSNHIPHL